MVIAFATLALMGVANGGGSAASAAYQYTPFGGSATLTRDPSDASVLIFTVSVNDGSNEVNDVFLDLSSNSYTVTPIDPAGPTCSGTAGGLVCSFPAGQGIPGGGQRTFRIRVSPTYPDNQVNRVFLGNSTTGQHVTFDVTGPPPLPPSTAHCDWTVDFLLPPKRAEIASIVHYVVEVGNGGTEACPPAALRVVAQRGGKDPHVTIVNDGTGSKGTDSLGVAVPGLAPGAEKSFRFARSPALPARSSMDLLDVDRLGPQSLTATMPPDGDGGSDESATASTEFELFGNSTEDSPCHAKGKATAAACSVAGGKLHAFTGRASGRVKKVEIALARSPAGARSARATCSWLRNARAQFVRTAATGRLCARARWLTARGTKHWRFALRRRLPRGTYVLFTRPVTPFGAPEFGFTARRHNRLTFTVR